MASADFSASSFRRYRRPWPFRADGEISRNKTHFFRPAGCGFTTLLRLGLGLRHVLLTCPQVGLVSAFCAYPPNFASDFLHPRPRGRKLVLGYLVPPNWPIGDFHSRPCVMSCVHTKARRTRSGPLSRVASFSSPGPRRGPREESQQLYDLVHITPSFLFRPSTGHADCSIRKRTSPCHTARAQKSLRACPRP